MDIQKTLKFLEFFSVITVGDNKIPNFSWKKQQTAKYFTNFQVGHSGYFNHYYNHKFN